MLALIATIFSLAVSGLNLIEDFNHNPPVYCANPSNPDVYAKRRQIPNLKAIEASIENLKLKQVQVTTRHGARTLSRPRECWKDYKPKWDCQSGEIAMGYTEKKPTSLSFQFPKHFDANPNGNKLKGSTCELGQLIPMGHTQQKLNGELLSKAYFKHRQPAKNLFDLRGMLSAKKSLDDIIYFRSTEYQRTRMSGAELLTSMLKNVYPKTTDPNIKLHTAEKAVDTLHPNSDECYDLDDSVYRAYADKEYFKLFEEKNAKAHDLAENMMGIEAHPKDGKGKWPWHAFDCFGSSICAGHDLPTGGNWTQDNVELVHAAATEELEFQFVFNNSRYSRVAIARFTYDVKAYAVKQLCGAKSADSKCVGNFFYQAKDADDMIAHLKDETQIRSYPFVYWSAHETTLGPFLAAFGEEFWKKISIQYFKKNNLFNGLMSPYPSYASLLVLEYYESKTDFYFRMIYNGAVITQHVPGCLKDKELCSVKTLFNAMSWATRDFSQKPCLMKKP